MDVSIIIVTFNTCVLTEECVRSIEENVVGVEYEIIIVDNASTDGSKFFFESRRNITYLYSETNLGFGKANNLAAKYARGKYLFFLNSDTILLNNALKYFLDYVSTYHSKKICLGGFLMDKNHRLTHSSGKFPTIWSVLLQYLTLPLKRKAFTFSSNDHVEIVDYIIGADLFVSSALFHQVNGFDERFFLYYEETDLQLRLSQIGILRMLIPGPEIVHLEGSSNPLSFRKKKHFWPIQSSFIYLRKHSSKMSYLLFRFFAGLILLPYTFFIKSPGRKDFLRTIFS